MATAAPVPISELTLEELVDTLVAGAAVVVAGTGEVFSLGADSCFALAFYRRDRKYWGRYNLSSKEITQLLDALNSPTVHKKIKITVAPRRIQKWSLHRVFAHRFAGLHRYCNREDGSPPPPFEWDVGNGASVIWGFNGAGKSSLLSAITWCLTGRALRSHMMPAEVHDPMVVEYLPDSPQSGSEDDDDEQADQPSLSIPPILPVPSNEDLKAIGDSPIQVDTCVELEFRAIDDSRIVKVTRRLSRSSSGKIKAEVEGLESLGISELGRSVGTIMPSIAAQMRFDEPTELGRAIADLTGLKPFSDFGNRAPKIVDRLEGRETEDARNRQAQLVIRFEEKLSHYVDTVAQQQALKPVDELLSPRTSSTPDCRQRLNGARTRATAATEDALGCFDKILRFRPPLDDEAKVDSLISTIDGAAKSLTPAELTTLPTVQSALAPLRLLAERDEDIQQARQILDDTFAEAAQMAEKLRELNKAKRWQLYARVAQWHEAHHPGAPFDECPVCSSSLDNVPKDDILDKDVATALEECRHAAEHLTKSAGEWARDRLTLVKAMLPQSVANVVKCDWSVGLLPYFSKVIGQELLARPQFKGVLKPLSENANAIWSELSTDLPLWTLPAHRSLPDIFGAKSDLQLLLDSIGAAVAAAEFRASNLGAFDSVFSRIVGKIAHSESTTIPTQSIEKLPIIDQLNALRSAASAVRPAARAIELITGLSEILASHEKEARHIEALRRAAEAVRPFCRFPALVEEQVSGLLQELGKGTRAWADRIYRPHYLDGPDFGGFGDSEGEGAVLALKARFGDTTAPAHQVLNSSALRAYVWGFLLALWERVWARQGGLACILLDDPQSLFDNLNAENMAAAVPKMCTSSMQPIVASNDNHFVQAIIHYLRARDMVAASSLLQLSPVSSSKLKASLIPLVEKLWEYRSTWRNDKNSVDKAREFVEPVRSYVETRLWDLLAADTKQLFKPSFADLIGRVASLRKAGQRPFNEEPFARLCRHPALHFDHEFYKALNTASHRPRDITPVDAQAVDLQLNSVSDAIEACATSQAIFLGRIPDEHHAGVPSNPPPAPTGLCFPNQQLAVLPALAARMDFSALGRAETALGKWDLADLGDVALFGIGGHTLGLSCLVGQTAIVRMSDEPENGDLVICQTGTSYFARRLALDRDDPARLILETIPSSARRLPPTHIVPRYSSRAMKIVGVLFDQHGPISGEAAPVTASSTIRSVRAIAPVVGASAHPVAPDGSRVLLAPIDRPDLAEISKLEGRVVAVAAADSPDPSGYCAGYLKRLGPILPNFGAVRILENVGPLGDSLHVHFPELGITPSSSIPSVLQIWRVCGVIY